MALEYADRVAETTATTGTGTYSLAGAKAGFQGFVAGVGTGNTCYYSATDGTDWEVGLGTVTDAAPDTLSRDTILASSNGGAEVDWGAGEKDVFVTAPASEIAKITNDHGSLQGLADDDHTQYVSLAPGTSGRNVIVASGATVVPLVIDGVASQSVDRTQWEDGSGNLRARITSEAEFSNAGGQTNSEIFGVGSTVTGSNAFSFGRGSTAGANSVAIGNIATASLNSVAIGGSVTGSSSSVAIGNSAGGNAQNAVLIGVSTTAPTNGGSSVAVGAGCTVGNNSTVVLLGRGVAATAANQMVVGSASFGIHSVFIGNAVTAAVPAATTYNATGGSGTNVAGADLKMAVGRGTGSGASGKYTVQVAPAGSSGTSLNTLVDSFQVDADVTAGNTRLLLYDVDTVSLKRVKVGANDSGPGGSGRALYIDNTA